MWGFNFAAGAKKEKVLLCAASWKKRQLVSKYDAGAATCACRKAQVLAGKMIISSGGHLILFLLHGQYLRGALRKADCIPLFQGQGVSSQQGRLQDL